MTTVSVYDARASLSRLIDRALAGEEIVITRNGKPVIKLVPAEEKPARRRLGTLAGEFDIPDEALLAPLPDDFLAYFDDGTPDKEGDSPVGRTGTAG
jgi:prevent-host-death family protein